jgi:two-component system, sensor histidine kinase PdtaS
MRRVEAIAVVHDTLSEGLSQSVDFDEVFERVLRLITEVASVDNGRVYPTFSGSFGVVPSRSATPLALALTELVTNAVEHGLSGADGQVWVTAERDEHELRVVVGDDGGGLPEGRVGAGLGTQIVRTLIEGELKGTIDWHTLTGSGTEVTITIPVSALGAVG